MKHYLKKCVPYNNEQMQIWADEGRDYLYQHKGGPVTEVYQQGGKKNWRLQGQGNGFSLDGDKKKKKIVTLLYGPNHLYITTCYIQYHNNLFIIRYSKHCPGL